MTLRALKLPQDTRVLEALIVPGFQYPDHPEWGVQADEAEAIADTMRSVRRMWPLLAPFWRLSPAMRDVLRAVIWEEDGKPVGTAFVSRQGGSDCWYISSVAVLPAYRRRGIARRLVEATIAEARRRGGKMVVLDVIEGNTPAIDLYLKLGFERFDEGLQFEYVPERQRPLPELPAIYRVAEVPFMRWRPKFALAGRVTPAVVRRYQPVVPALYRVPLAQQVPMLTISRLAGDAARQMVIRLARGGEVVAAVNYQLRTRPGGFTICNPLLDPAHGHLAPYLLGYVAHRALLVSPGRRLQTQIPGWQQDLVEAARRLDFALKLKACKLGMALD
ncbi:MAG: GNAT family N-acetyltransferase [Ktedonobacterales bacterium]